jgi:4-aminobutyrate aminotransferase
MTWKPGSHGTTFGGNPVCIAAGLATFDLIESEYRENAGQVGDYIFQKTAKWTEKHKIVGDVRGRGLMIGIEIVHDQKTKEKGADLRNHIVDLAFRRGLCLLGAGENTLRLSPPLLIDREQADAALAILEQCVQEVEGKA